MALSILKQKINKREYKNFAEFVRDCALIPHNAQTYNRPNSQAYEDALVIKVRTTRKDFNSISVAEYHRADPRSPR
jgi:chromatin structure-remodeling complex subunit RSC1/2